MKYCTNCGTELKENARFCGKCGAVVRGQEKEMSEDRRTASETSAGRDKPKKSKKGRKILLAFFIIVILFVLLAGSAYLLLRKETVYRVAEIKDIEIETIGCRTYIEQYTYNEDAVRISGNAYVEYSDLAWNMEYECDQDGNILKECIYTDDGELYREDEYIYDENGNWVEWKIVYYDETGEVTAENLIEISYTEDGVEQGWIQYDENHEKVLECEHTYNEEKKIIHSVHHYFQNSENDCTINHSYDEYVNPVKLDYYNQEGTLYFQREYTYECFRIPRKNWNFSEINFVEEIKSAVSELTGN